MTNAELAELRGEIVGLKVLLANCLSFIAGQTSDPAAHLAAIRDHAIAGLAEITDARIRQQQLPVFRAAAAGIVLQVVGAGATVVVPGSPRPRLQ
jgi:hypothetical protein